MSYIPTILIPGIGQSRVNLLDASGNVVKRAWPLDLDSKSLFKKLTGPLTKMMMFRRDAGFSDAVANLVKDAIAPMAMNPDGSPKNRIETVTYVKSVAECSEDEKRYIYRMVPVESLSDVIGEENLFFFAYNSFGNLRKTAADLDEFVEFVLGKTGAEKVNIVPISLGGAVANEYLAKFAYKNRINRVVNFVAALDGSLLIADLLAGNLNLDDPAALLSLIGGGAAEEIKPILKVLPDGVIGACAEKIVKILAEDVISNSTLMWGIIPRDIYPSLADRYISDAAHASVRAQADEFCDTHKDYGAFIGGLMAQGIEFFNVCGYGRQLIPMVTSSDVSSDTIIPTVSASMGALTAPLGSSLPEGDTKYRSPDGSVDAASSLLPDRTWFFKNQQHDGIAYNGVALEIAKKLLTEDGFNSVFADENFPQYNNARSDGRVKKYINKAQEKLSGFCNNPDELEKAIDDAEKFLAKTIVPECGDAVVLAKLKAALGE